MESLVQTNKFEILDMPGMNTIAFVVEENPQGLKENNLLLSLQKLECDEIEEDGKVKKVFNVITTNAPKQYIVLLTLTQSKAILSTGELSEDGFVAVEKNIPLTYGTIYNQSGVEYKEISYTPDFKRHFAIIDTQTTEEVKPILYIDEKTNQVKGRCKILPHRPYIVLELRLQDTKEDRLKKLDDILSEDDIIS